MSIRSILLALVAPLFLLLAAVNGGLLYVWERAEAQKGLESQAIAAAVSAAAFLEAPGAAERLLADPVRMAGLRAAVDSAEGLEGLWILPADGTPLRLAGVARDPGVGIEDSGAAPQATGVRRDADGRRHVLGRAPLGDGGAVVARIDAEPLSTRLLELQRLTAALVVGAGLLGLILALWVAGAINRELRWNSAQIAAVDENALDRPPDFQIRETRDLGAAVRLMRASVAGRMARSRRELSRRDRARNVTGSIQALRPELLPDVSAEAAGAIVAARLSGQADAGRFVALAGSGDRGAVVLAEAGGDSPEARLAVALAARRFLETRLLEGTPAERIEEARVLFGLERIAWRAWSSDEPLTGLEVIVLADPEATARARAYVATAQGLKPEEVVADLEVLLSLDGAIAVLAPSASGGRPP
jgi:hypothetical protein